jgi:hypothetical protein
LVPLACKPNKTAAKLVAMSGKAFALLTFDNYIDKWINIAEEEKEKKTKGKGENRK